MIVPNVTYERRQAALDSLEAYAKGLGLDWVIAWLNAYNEPYAYRLICRDGVNVLPAQVIGETEEQARACISLAAATKK